MCILMNNYFIPPSISTANPGREELLYLYNIFSTFLILKFFVAIQVSEERKGEWHEELGFYVSTGP